MINEGEGRVAGASVREKGEGGIGVKGMSGWDERLMIND